ncbi:MAG: Cys-Xaa-Xaa-Xaa repeat radical SAM target protein [Prevotella sp.]|nr:Cys-Xaa-Xaa-Xaa repeat radical SAM target protein [Prevotella sp.]
MHNNKKNEELQSRREFFKKAAKGALPILGAIVLAGAPGILNATEAQSTSCTSCSTHCGTSCWRDGCSSTCSGGCKGGCRGTCQNTAKRG